MRFVACCILSLLAFYANCQEKVGLDELRNYVGKIVEVRGKVSQIDKIGEGDTCQAIIYVGGVSPKEKLSIFVKSVIKGETDYILTDKSFSNSMVIVKGKVELLKGKPKISIETADDLKFIIDEEVRVSKL